MKKLIFLLLLISICLFTLVNRNAYAVHWNIVRVLCIEDFRFIDFEPPPIPVGCEVIDCCPGCPGPEMFDWRIHIAGDLIESVNLEFLNLPDEAAKAVTVKGDIKRPGANVFQMKAKETWIRGLPGSVEGRLPVAFPKVTFNNAKIKEITNGKQDFDGDEASVVIQQMLGPVVVNEFRLVYLYRRCWDIDIRPLTDLIDLDNNTADDRAIVMLTGRRAAGCIGNEREFDNTSDRIGIGNMLSNSGCTTESVVFSDDNAMEIVSPTTVWTDSLGDELKVNLDPMAVMPVNIVLARAGANAAATNDMNNTILLYNTNNAGIDFNATTQDVSGSAADVNTVTNNARCSAANLADLQGSALYNANALNVYYINGAFTAANCVNDRLVVFVGNNANAASLAHEFGHSFSLFGGTATGGHTNNLAAFGNDNIMWGGGPANRDNFSVGQVFRFNIDNDSSLNTTGVRNGLTRDCPALTTNINCPGLALDSLPH